jgi:hypothetical protein
MSTHWSLGALPGKSLCLKRKCCSVKPRALTSKPLATQPGEWLIRAQGRRLKSKAQGSLSLKGDKMIERSRANPPSLIKTAARPLWWKYVPSLQLTLFHWNDMGRSVIHRGVFEVGELFTRNHVRENYYACVPSDRRQVHNTITYC